MSLLIIFPESYINYIMQTLYRIKNKYKEELDTLVEGNENANTTIVFVHEFGTQKDESYGYFVDIAKALHSNYRTVRFDFSGYGKSQGKQEDANYEKHNFLFSNPCRMKLLGMNILKNIKNSRTKINRSKRRSFV